MKTGIAALVAFSLLVHAAGAASEIENGGIAFAGKRLGKPVVYLRSTTSSGSRVMPTAGWAGDPAVSPAGRRIAFTRRGRAGAQIWSVYTDGTALVQLTGGPQDFDPAWSPEGGSIAFERGPSGRRDIYRVGADSVGLRRLTFASSDDSSPTWSRLGRIAFVRLSRRGGDIYVLPASGGSARPLTGGTPDDRWPAWSPTGRTLAFARGQAGSRDLYRLAPDSGDRRRLTALPGDETEPAWSPDGRWIVFTHREDGRRRLYLMRVGRRPVARLDSERLRPFGSSRVGPRAPDWQPAGLSPVIAAAGDIACDPEDRNFAAGLGAGAYCRQRQTSDLLLRMDLAAVLAPGDLQYEDGQLWKFQSSFDQSWGRVKPLIRPVPGNHEYEDSGAAGYFDYFNGPGQPTGPAGRRDQGYYSFDVGSWHVVALNSECRRVGGCAADDPQERWLRADLAAHPAACTLAFWHHPRFTSGRSGAEGPMLPVWNALYEANVDAVVNGHEHFYERFAPQAPDGSADASRGIREFIAGTGGRSRLGYLSPAPNSEFRENRVSGVLTLSLGEGEYKWRFLSAPSGRVLDSGTAACH
jgi:acid phosphatase type 7